MTESDTVQYSITEVANMLELPQHVLRMWESQFPTIAPVRGRNGRRAYTAETIQAVKQVQKLLHIDGLTMQQARDALDGGSASTITAKTTSTGYAPIDAQKLQSILDALQAASAALARQ